MRFRLVPLVAIAAVLLVVIGAEAQDPKGSVGLGLGVPYGVVGANVEYGVIENLYLSGGIGTTVLAGLGYSVGARYYLGGTEGKFRPRAGAYYGTTTVVEGFYDDESYDGVAASVGMVIAFGSSGTHGLDLDVVYLVTQDDEIDALEDDGVDTGSSIKLSLGYRFHF